jgi:hypothetical protein
MSKVCSRCQELKPDTEYGYHAKTSDHLSHICHNCRTENARLWNQVRNNQIPGFLYLFRSDNGLYKIGHSTNVEARLHECRKYSPVAIDLIESWYNDDANGLEQELHIRYKDLHHHAEWFALSPEQVATLRVELTGVVQ